MRHFATHTIFLLALSKAEIVRRSLDFLFIPLQYYVSEMLLRSYPKEEVAKMLEKRPGRVRCFSRY